MLDNNIENIISKETEIKNKIKEMHLQINENNLRLNGKTAKNPEKQIYDEMAKIHSQYISSYKQTGNLENIKHALFIQWFGAL